MRRRELSHRLAETRDQNWFSGLADSLEHGQTSGFEFRNGNLFHAKPLYKIVLSSETMVNTENVFLGPVSVRAI
jgi:hypothetical protein